MGPGEMEEAHRSMGGSRDGVRVRWRGWARGRRRRPAGRCPAAPRDGLLLQELVAGQAAVPRPALRVEDPQRGPPVRHPVVVLRDADLRPLPHDLATQPDPAAPASSRRRPAPSSSAARSGAGVPAGSRTSRSAPARRANATSRASWSARPGERGPRRAGAARGASVTARSTRPRWAGVASGRAAGAGRPARAIPRSSTRMSTARAWSSVPAIASAWAGSSGTSTASHSRLTPRAPASTGSSARGRSTQAASAPPACASARTRSASVVAPLEPAPASATVPARGKPPAARSASSSGKPVGIARSASAGVGRERGVTGTGSPPGGGPPRARRTPPSRAAESPRPSAPGGRRGQRRGRDCGPSDGRR